MTAEQLLKQLSDKSVRLWEDEGKLHFHAPKGAISNEIREELSNQKYEIISLLRHPKFEPTSNLPQIEPDLKNRNQPFPLSDIQSAYLIGRDRGFEIGNVACHAYYELECPGIDLDRLGIAVNKLIKRHEVLRLVFLENRTQKILKYVPEYQINTIDLRGLKERDVEVKRELIRKEMSHKIHEADKWPLFEIGALQLDDSLALYFSFDLLVADFSSAFILFRDLIKLYSEPDFLLEPINISFRDYVLAEQKLRKTEPFLKARDYWMSRANSFPSSPQLPLVKASGSIEKPQFIRRESFINKDAWKSLKERASRVQITPSVVLMTAYAEVLAKWSKDSHFAINLTLFNRLPLHPQIMDVAGDFTVVSLLEVAPKQQDSFEEKARRIQKQLWDDMDNRQFSGVSFIRELARIRGAEGTALMPVVFSSTIGVKNSTQTDLNLTRLGTLTYGITQTPQVYLDHQVMEYGDQLHFVWDTVDELFPEGLLDEMFEAYTKTLARLAWNKNAWNELSCKLVSVKPPEHLSPEQKTAHKLSSDMLHALFEKQASLQPEKEAVVTSAKRMSYGELKTCSDNIAGILRKKGALPGKLVAVVMEKGWEQVVGALGILKSGAAYLPIDPESPAQRLELLLQDGEVDLILTQSWLEKKINWPDNMKIFSVDSIEPDESDDAPPENTQQSDKLAYVIYTSGSTGNPKGVMIDHAGAVNTILDVNDRFSVNSSDRVLALAALNFDLSVYDIFGTLAAGATIVIPEPQGTNDPAHWSELLDRERITVWNSVPQLMQMLTEYSSGCSKKRFQSLRLVLMSGDWIPLELPEKIKLHFPEVAIYSLGGATEASIWSIYFPVEKIHPKWNSIPYGRSMTNQEVYVFNENLSHCPAWVTGDLYIGGVGLAKGYLHDAKKTNVSFIQHPETGKRLYKTGDLGRYLPDGNIEFLGREDFQVKINGYRIELGEIEASIKTYPAVKDAVVSVAATQTGKSNLIAYVVADLNADSPLIKTDRVDTNKSNELWDSIKTAQQEKGEIFRNPKLHPYSIFHEYMEKASIEQICYALSDMNFFVQPDERYTLEEVCQKGGIHSRYHSLIAQWIDLLVRKGVLIKEDKDTYTNQNRCFGKNMSEHLTQEIEQSSILKESTKRLNFYLRNVRKHFINLLQGKTEPLKVFYADDNKISPENILQFMPCADSIIDMAKKILLEISRTGSPERPIKILEIGAQAGEASAAFIPFLPDDKVTYTCSDLSSFFTAKTNERFNEFPFVRSSILNIDQDPQTQGFESHSFDVIIAVNSLHRVQNVGKSLKNTKELLSPTGLLLLVEGTVNSSFQHVSIKFIQENFTHYEDEREKSNLPLLSIDEWQSILESIGFERFILPFESYTEMLGHDIILAQSPSSVKRFDPLNLRKYLEQKLPENMIPSTYIHIDTIPLTPNGKIDRKSLPIPKEGIFKAEKKDAMPRNSYEQSVSEIWKKILERDHIGIYDNFFEIGGDSLIAVELVNEFFSYFKVEISLPDLFKSPTVAGMADVIIEVLNKNKSDRTEDESLPQLIPAPEHRNMPFPLTDVQQAYWVGRSNAFELGNVSTHTYFEIENDNMDVNRLNTAWQKVIERHEMLRAIILPDGQQVVLEEVPPYNFNIKDLRNKDPETANAYLKSVRQEMEHQMISVDTWPLFDIRVSLYDENKVRMHLSLDALILDGWSMVVIFRDWYQYYLDTEVSLPKLKLSYRDYVLADMAFKESVFFKRDQEYALNRLSQIPPSPDLPLSKKLASVDKPIFKRLSYTLKKSTWQKIKTRANQHNLTPSGVLVAAYAKVLGMWSKNDEFTINLTFFNRLPLHPQVNDIVGDFTTLKLLPVTNQSSETFKIWAEEIQQQLWNELDHRYFNGVNYIRELARLNGDMRAAIMPVVFTSFLGIGLNDNEDESGLSQMGRIVYNVSQTPQVYLDNQVGERNGTLSVNWDVVDELFPDGLLSDMFDAYCNLLEILGDENSSWGQINRSLLPATQKEKRKEFNLTDASISSIMLHELFTAQVSKNKEKIAITTSYRSFSYGELSAFANQIGYQLQNEGIKHNKLVAIVMEKGWEQIAAALGILMSGGAYLPISADTPKERLEHLICDGEVDIVLTQSWIEKDLEYLENVKFYSIDTIKPDLNNMKQLESLQNADDLAYVIYTSGSTGVPKGVMIDHKGAVNTILDINKRFNITHNDKVLALSNLNFDLSVYDIFGTLAAGGTVVFPAPDKIKDPAHWIDLMNNEYVTIWNTVPMFMQMLVEYASGSSSDIEQSLRLVLLSGDWIPPDLPDKIKNLVENARVISLGGATEASIWSIFYPIKAVNPELKSIPYGRPMYNQKMYVLNKKLEERPDCVTGDLYIGGIGLAKGYWKDKEKTDFSFITHPETGKRLYKTGDLGRYLPDGNIEFLGREDFQVKINGYRVELGEIESVLNLDPGVERSVTVAVEDENSTKQLISYLVPGKNEKSKLFDIKFKKKETIDQCIDLILQLEKRNLDDLTQNISQNSYIGLQNHIEDLALKSIIDISAKLKLFSSTEVMYSVDEILTSSGIKPEFKPLIAQWLHLLENKRYLSGNIENGYRCIAPLKNKDLGEYQETATNTYSVQNIEKLNERFNLISIILPDVLTGKKDLLNFLLEEDSILGAESLSNFNPAEKYFKKITCDLTGTAVEAMKTETPFNILEIGTRAENITEDILRQVSSGNITYTYTDESQFYIDRAADEYSSYPNFTTKIFDMNNSPVKQGFFAHEFDLIIAYNTLHRSSDINKTISYIKSLLSPGGVLAMMESTRNSNVELITTGLFESGNKKYTDFRLDIKRPLISADDWKNVLSEGGFERILQFPGMDEQDYFDQHVFAAFASSKIKQINHEECRKLISSKLPEYMVPMSYVMLDHLPLTINGKIDIKKLPEIKIDLNDTKTIGDAQLPETPTQKKLYQIWLEVLNKEIPSININFFDMGGDSLLATRMINLIRDMFNIEIALQAIFEESTIYLLAKQVDAIIVDNTNIEEGSI